MKTYRNFSTERLTLRPTSIGDAAFIVELLNSPLWIQNIGDRNVYNISDAETYVKTKMLAQLEVLGYGNYTVIRDSDEALIGTVGLYDRPGTEGIDIGFAFLPQYFGQGYALESAQRIMQAAVQEFGLKIIGGYTLPSNKASQKLLEKLGLRFVDMRKMPNDKEEIMYYEYRVDEDSNL
jgi:RimJ/RimL family protein N-acetyltransferase